MGIELRLKGGPVDLATRKSLGNFSKNAGVRIPHQVSGVMSSEDKGQQVKTCWFQKRSGEKKETVPR